MTAEEGRERLREGAVQQTRQGPTLRGSACGTLLYQGGPHRTGERDTGSLRSLLVAFLWRPERTAGEAVTERGS